MANGPATQSMAGPLGNITPNGAVAELLPDVEAVRSSTRGPTDAVDMPKDDDTSGLEKNLFNHEEAAQADEADDEVDHEHQQEGGALNSAALQRIEQQLLQLAKALAAHGAEADRRADNLHEAIQDAAGRIDRLEVQRAQHHGLLQSLTQQHQDTAEAVGQAARAFDGIDKDIASATARVKNLEDSATTIGARLDNMEIIVSEAAGINSEVADQASRVEILESDVAAVLRVVDMTVATTETTLEKINAHVHDKNGSAGDSSGASLIAMQATIARLERRATSTEKRISTMAEHVTECEDTLATLAREHVPAPREGDDDTPPLDEDGTDKDDRMIEELAHAREMRHMQNKVNALEKKLAAVSEEPDGEESEPDDGDVPHTTLAAGAKPRAKDEDERSMTTVDDESVASTLGIKAMSSHEIKPYETNWSKESLRDKLPRLRDHMSDLHPAIESLLESPDWREEMRTDPKARAADRWVLMQLRMLQTGNSHELKAFQASEAELRRTDKAEARSGRALLERMEALAAVHAPADVRALRQRVDYNEPAYVTVGMTEAAIRAAHGQMLIDISNLPEHERAAYNEAKKVRLLIRTVPPEVTYDAMQNFRDKLEDELDWAENEGEEPPFTYAKLSVSIAKRMDKLKRPNGALVTRKNGDVEPCNNCGKDSCTHGFNNCPKNCKTNPTKDFKGCDCCRGKECLLTIPVLPSYDTIKARAKSKDQAMRYSLYKRIVKWREENPDKIKKPPGAAVAETPPRPAVVVVRAGGSPAGAPALGALMPISEAEALGHEVARFAVDTAVTLTVNEPVKPKSRVCVDGARVAQLAGDDVPDLRANDFDTEDDDVPSYTEMIAERADAERATADEDRPDETDNCAACGMSTHGCDCTTCERCGLSDSPWDVQCTCSIAELVPERQPAVCMVRRGACCMMHPECGDELTCHDVSHDPPPPVFAAPVSESEDEPDASDDTKDDSGRKTDSQHLSDLSPLSEPDLKKQREGDGCDDCDEHGEPSTDYLACRDLIIQVDLPKHVRGVYYGTVKVHAIIVRIDMQPEPTGFEVDNATCELVYNMDEHGGNTWNGITVARTMVLNAVDRLNLGTDDDANHGQKRKDLGWVYERIHDEPQQGFVRQRHLVA